MLRKHQKTAHIIKKYYALWLVLLGLMLANCEKESALLENTKALDVEALRAQWKPEKIKICHQDDLGTYQLITVSVKAWSAHERHGDVRLDDQDKDGYVPDNGCSFGEMGDCDDHDPEVNPDMAGACTPELDTDGDGVPDLMDRCPFQTGQQALEGCPDNDGDGIADPDDSCPTQAGLASLNGCPDADGDGITDNDDECPNEAGPLANNGCPELTDYDVLRLLYEANPGNNLGWDLSNLSMDDWTGVFLDENGKVKGLRLLFGTQITRIVPEIEHLNNLLELVCACEGLERLPEELGNLESLIVLGVTGSQIKEIPETIVSLSTLKGLAIFNNKNITHVPIWIGDLVGLETLNLSGNSLNEVPAVLGNLSNLRILSLEDNPVTSIPQVVCNLADEDTEVLLDQDDICQ